MYVYAKSWRGNLQWRAIPAGTSFTELILARIFGTSEISSLFAFRGVNLPRDAPFTLYSSKWTLRDFN